MELFRRCRSWAIRMTRIVKKVLELQIMIKQKQLEEELKGISTSKQQLDFS